ncbi:MAG: hypothetical protein QXI52_02575 [Nitrososphaerota archaeon]
MKTDEMNKLVERAMDTITRIISLMIEWIRKHPSLALIILGVMLVAAVPGQGTSVLIPAFIFILVGVALFITSRVFYQRVESSETLFSKGSGERSELAFLLSKLLTEEEARIVEVLVESNGTVLQREIPYKTGLSKLKVHRIITRLASRGLLERRKENGKVIVTMDEKLLRFLKGAGQPSREK